MGSDNVNLKQRIDNLQQSYNQQLELLNNVNTQITTIKTENTSLRQKVIRVDEQLSRAASERTLHEHQLRKFIRDVTQCTSTLKGSRESIRTWCHISDSVLSISDTYLNNTRHTRGDNDDINDISCVSGDTGLVLSRLTTSVSEIVNCIEKAHEVIKHER